MELKWKEDTRHLDCWDLRDAKGDLKGFTIRREKDGVVEWCSINPDVDLKFPGLSLDEVKAIGFAMVRLEG